MKSARNESETRFRELLLRLGYSEQKIQEPDLNPSIIGTADFLVGDVVFEVKEICPGQDAIQRIETAKKEIAKEGRTSLWQMPSVRKQFKSDLKDARRKFKAYENCATVLVEDLSAWGLFVPDIEELLFGVMAIHLNVATATLIGKTWQQKEVRTDQNRTIGAFIFLTPDNVLVYHNLMAHEYKMMPIEYIQRFQKVTDKQYIFMNIPGGPPLIRHLM